MDLYDFITNKMSEPPRRERANEVAENVAQEVQEVVKTEGEVLRDKIAELEGGLRELRQKKDELDLKLREAEAGWQAARTTEKSLRERVSGLEQDAAELVKSKASEVELLRRELSDTVARLKQQNSLLQQELSVTVGRLEHAEIEKEDSLHNLERIQKDFSGYIQKTNIAIVIACIAAVAAIAGLLIYSYSHRTVIEQKPAVRIEQQKQAVSIEQQKPAVRPVPPAAGKAGPIARPMLKGADKTGASSQGTRKASVRAVWPAKPFTLDTGGFRVSLVPLDPEAVKKLPAALRHEAAGTHHFYIVKVRAARGVLSAEFMKSPSIDFISRDNVHARQAVHTSTSARLYAGRGTVQLRCLVSLKKDFQPVGIIIGPMNKEALRISIS